MKRNPALAPLSREHHASLVLARRIGNTTRTGNQTALAALRAELIALGERELKPHFMLEENALLPQIAAAGGEEFARRTRREHAALLAALDALDPDDPAGFAHFGTLLDAHVRFEERELFPWCERHLAAEQLDAIARLLPKTPRSHHDYER